MTRNDIKNASYHRTKISKRCAVKCLIDIADEVLPYGSISLGSSYCSDKWDSSIYNLVSEIRKLKYDSKKYHILQKILKDTVK